MIGTGPSSQNPETTTLTHSAMEGGNNISTTEYDNGTLSVCINLS